MKNKKQHLAYINGKDQQMQYKISENITGKETVKYMQDYNDL